MGVAALHGTGRIEQREREAPLNLTGDFGVGGDSDAGRSGTGIR
jgi:hypothetical protein